MTNPPVIQPDVLRDEKLAQVLQELTEQVRQGRRPDVEAVARHHPDLADELRQLWPALVLAEELAKPAAHSLASQDQPEQIPSPTETSLPPGLPRTFGDYELLEEIGRGGMGVVYKARQHSLNRLVAIKMILRGELASAADLARFRAEAESAARLEHPNIVPVYEVGECDGQAYFSMKCVEGTTLGRLAAKGPLPPREAARYMIAICRAIDFAHRHGILHRDLKPSNVLIDRDDRPMITDFGLAKRVEGTKPTGCNPWASLTQTGAIVGTPNYMSPEQAAGSRGKLSPASDVYSLGTILYELLTGRPPFQAASPVDTLMLVLEQDPLLPRLLNHNIDRDLEMICLKCLQKPSDLRYASAEELARDLEAYLNGDSVSARSGSFAQVLGRLFRETHHASVLENWGLLWMWHSLALIVLCSTTNLLAWRGVDNVFPYLAIWVIGFGTWASIFWALRRRAGPVTFVERQIAHVWLASSIGCMSLFGVEALLKLPVLKLSPVLALLAGMVFLVKAGMLSGSFYISAAACFVTAALMAIFPSIGLFLFGLVSAVCFFIPGLKYYRQRMRSIPPAR
jgi:serine/threonine-protein kinase